MTDLVPVEDTKFYRIETYFLNQNGQKTRKTFMAYCKEEFRDIRTFLEEQDIYYTVEYLGDR